MTIGFTDRTGLQPETRIDRLKPVELELTRIKATDKAVLVEDGAGAQSWLPRKHIAKLEEGMFGAIRVTIPTWLAIEKGLRSVPGQTKTLF
jgi:hypothetical protein